MAKHPMTAEEKEAQMLRNRRRYLSEFHRLACEKRQAAIEEMRKHPMTQEEMKAQCDQNKAEVMKNGIKHIADVLAAMSKCDSTTLIAAISLLPDIMGLDGISTIIAATGRMAAEYLPDRIDDVASSVAKAARHCLIHMEKELNNL